MERDAMAIVPLGLGNSQEQTVRLMTDLLDTWRGFLLSAAAPSFCLLF